MSQTLFVASFNESCNQQDYPTTSSNTCNHDWWYTLLSPIEDETSRTRSNEDRLRYISNRQLNGSKRSYATTKVPHSQYSIPRPHSSTFRSRSELAQQLIPLKCIFKEDWIKICENAPATEKLATIRQCLDPKKVTQKKPQEMNSIMNSAMLTDEECGWLLDVRRKMMRQRNRQTKRKTPAKD